jgi:uncharacterized membrane protein
MKRNFIQLSVAFVFGQFVLWGVDPNMLDRSTRIDSDVLFMARVVGTVLCSALTMFGFWVFLHHKTQTPE